jgi:hypothetical protein
MNRLAKHIVIAIGLQSALLLTIASSSCNPVKDAKFAADLLHCIDEHADLEPAQVALLCGVEATPSFVNLFMERKLAKATSKPCVIVTVDAGPPKGPGI